MKPCRVEKGHLVGSTTASAGETMSSIQYVSSRELHPNTDAAAEGMVRGEFGHELARRLPHLLREKTVDLGETDKVFASQWLSEDEVIAGTKCNRVRS